MTRGNERETLSLRMNSETTFVMKLTNDELRKLRADSEGRITTFGDGTRMSVRASDVISLVEELLQRRKSDGL